MADHLRWQIQQLMSKERFMCLCTYLLSRAIHIEMAYAIDATFFRLVADDHPTRMSYRSYLGQRGNFVITAHQQREYVDEFDSKARKSLAMQCIS